MRMVASVLRYGSERQGANPRWRDGVPCVAFMNRNLGAAELNEQRPAVQVVPIHAYVRGPATYNSGSGEVVEWAVTQQRAGVGGIRARHALQWGVWGGRPPNPYSSGTGSLQAAQYSNWYGVRCTRC